MGSSRIDRSALSGDIEMKAISSISFFDTNDEKGNFRIAGHLSGRFDNLDHLFYLGHPDLYTSHHLALLDVPHVMVGHPANRSSPMCMYVRGYCPRDTCH